MSFPFLAFKLLFKPIFKCPEYLPLGEVALSSLVYVLSWGCSPAQEDPLFTPERKCFASLPDGA